MSTLDAIKGPLKIIRNLCQYVINRTQQISVGDLSCRVARFWCRHGVKHYRAKRKPYVNMDQKRRHVLWAKAHLKWTVSKWKSVPRSDRSKFDILVGNPGCRVLRSKEEGNLPACHHRSVQKHKCIRYGQLACFWRHCEWWKVYIKILEQHMLPSRRRLYQGRPCVFQQDNAKHILQLLQQQGFVVEESGCWFGLPAVQIFHL